MWLEKSNKSSIHTLFQKWYWSLDMKTEKSEWKMVKGAGPWSSFNEYEWSFENRICNLHPKVNNGFAWPPLAKKKKKTVGWLVCTRGVERPIHLVNVVCALHLHRPTMGLVAINNVVANKFIIANRRWSRNMIHMQLPIFVTMKTNWLHIFCVLNNNQWFLAIYLLCI